MAKSNDDFFDIDYIEVPEINEVEHLPKEYDIVAISSFSAKIKDAPMPRFDLLDVDKYNRLTVQTQRGCVHSCEFCGSSRLLTPKYKVKPVKKVISEIREIKKIWKEPFIEFADDNTFVNKKHSKALLRELKKENVKWFTETDISVAEDDELNHHFTQLVQKLYGKEFTKKRRSQFYNQLKAV